VYSREIDDQILTLRPSGWTFRRTFVLYDEETGTLWYPFPDKDGLTGIAGPLQDRFLPALDSKRAHFGAWRQDNPDTKHMSYPLSRRW
jgi:hypothetical protein